MVKTETIVGSPRAKELFDVAFRSGALFYANDKDIVRDLREAPPMFDVLNEWRERGIMPFAWTAISYDSKSARQLTRTTAVFSYLPGTDALRWHVRYELMQEDSHRLIYATHAETKEDILWMRPDATGELPPLREPWPDVIQHSATMGLAGFVWLIRALQSARYTAVESTISRQLARSSGAPRKSWIIQVRPRGSGQPSMRQQFAAVVRAAHAVRGHLRTDSKTGEKSIRVRPYVRGQGDVVQIKDYAVATGAQTDAEPDRARRLLDRRS